MEEQGKLQYDYFGEFTSQEGVFRFAKPVPKIECSREFASKMDISSSGEDSLMEFIADYFQGDGKTDFTMNSVDSDSPEHGKISKPCEFDLSSSLSDNAFLESSSNSEGNTSIEMFSSPDASLTLKNENAPRSESSDSRQQSNRRKSISYEIRFLNSKVPDGKVRIQIVPTEKNTDLGNDYTGPTPPSPPPRSFSGEDASNKLQQENSWLRHQILDLEKKLRCIEAESERVVAELTRIIERKNEMISQLELQIAGIKFMNGD